MGIIKDILIEEVENCKYQQDDGSCLVVDPNTDEEIEFKTEGEADRYLWSVIL